MPEPVLTGAVFPFGLTIPIWMVVMAALLREGGLYKVLACTLGTAELDGT